MNIPAVSPVVHFQAYLAVVLHVDRLLRTRTEVIVSSFSAVRLACCVTGRGGKIWRLDKASWPRDSTRCGDVGRGASCGHCGSRLWPVSWLRPEECGSASLPRRGPACACVSELKIQPTWRSWWDEVVGELKQTETEVFLPAKMPMDFDMSIYLSIGGMDEGWMRVGLFGSAPRTASHRRGLALTHVLLLK